MKIRPHGTADECSEVPERLAGIVEVLAVLRTVRRLRRVGACARVRRGTDRAARARHQHERGAAAAMRSRREVPAVADRLSERDEDLEAS
jgi:hypothetical protein